jgi:hypothetical protein
MILGLVLLAGGAAAAFTMKGEPAGPEVVVASAAYDASVALPARTLQTTRPERPERGPRVPSRFPELVRPERPDWEPLTATYVWRDGTGPRAEVRLTRRNDRVHIGWVRGDQEWYFRRNPLDPAYFEGMLTDHPNRRIVLFHFSDLRFEGLARTWEGAGNLGLDRDVLEALAPTGRTRESFGLTFAERRRKDDDSGSEIESVWWNEDRRLALEVVRCGKGGRRIETLTALDDEVDANLLERPTTRRPDYTCIDLGDSCDVCGTAHGCGTPHADSEATTIRHPASGEEKPAESAEHAEHAGHGEAR